MDSKGRLHVWSKMSDYRWISNTHTRTKRIPVRKKGAKVRESMANATTYRCMSSQSCH